MKRIVNGSSQLQPDGGDGVNFAMFYTGPNGGVRTEDAEAWALEHGFRNEYWASDDTFGMKGMYNGDTIVFYKATNKMPSGYAEDARKYGKVIPEAVTQSDINSAVYNALSEALFEFGESRVNMVSKEKMKIALDNFLTRFYRDEDYRAVAREAADKIGPINVDGCLWNEDDETYESVANCTSNWDTIEDAAEAVCRYLENAQVEVVIVNGDLAYWAYDHWTEQEVINDLTDNL